MTSASLCALVAALVWGQFAPTGPPDTLEYRKPVGVPCRVIRVKLADPRVRIAVEVSRGFPNQAESFSSLVARGRPTAAINGSYFSKTDLRPIGDIVVDGSLVHRGFMGTALAITRENEAIIRRVHRGHAEDWTGYETVLACGPKLVSNGQVDLLVDEEGFHDPHVMASTPRMGVGLNAAHELLLVNTLAPVDFARWAEVMKELGCVDAMNLDAGASLAMYYRGRTLRAPGRALTNILMVYVDSKPRDNEDNAPAKAQARQKAPAIRKPSGAAPPIGWPPAREKP